MIDTVSYPFLNATPKLPREYLMPMLPLALGHGPKQVTATGLLDTGATVNLLPYSVGIELGLVWVQQKIPVVLSGNLARIAARGIKLTATIADFKPVRLAFAWAATDEVRLLLGQANFFQEFDVCFFRAQARFELKPRVNDEHLP
jgi:hypothetical protein